MLAFFSDRKFGANGFYANPSATEQYEETQASLIGVTTSYKKNNLTIKPNLYWKRNQDIYIYLRQDPSVYRNLHISFPILSPTLSEDSANPNLPQRQNPLITVGDLYVSVSY